MQDLYSEWNCTDENSCLGGCLATGQLSYDALTATSEAIQPLISTRYADKFTTKIVLIQWLAYSLCLYEIGIVMCDIYASMNSLQASTKTLHG